MQSSRQTERGGAALALVFAAFCACSLDSRTLLEAPAAGGVSGTSAGAGGNSGGGSSSQFGGTGSGAGNSGASGSGGSTNRDSGKDARSDSNAGEGGSGAVAGSGGTNGVSGGNGDASDGPSSSGCGDLDKNGVQDCTEPLLRNSRFDTDATGWKAEPNVEQLWDFRDSTGAAGSGALSLTNTNVVDTDLMGMTMVGSQQCLDVDALRKYKVAALIFIPDGQGEGNAGINVFLYSGPGCTRTLLHAYTPVLRGEVGVWDGVAGTVETSPATQSMLVRLVASKPFSQTSFKASFDNVLVRPD
jgi:hypothetical protein